MSEHVKLEQVHARDEQGPRGRARGRLVGLYWAIGAGLHAVVGRPDDGTVVLCELLAGERRARVGRLHIDGKDPSKSPALRRRIGSLLPSPSLTGGTVQDAVRIAIAIRGGDDPLARFGLAALATRKLATIAKDELRAVELALALSLPDPRLVVLYEPFAIAPAADRAAIRERLLELAGAAAVVLITSAPADALAVAERIYLLDSGRWASADVATGWPARASGELVLWLDDADGRAAPELAAALGKNGEITGVAWQHAADRPGISAVSLRSHDLDQAALIVAETCAALSVSVRALHAPPLDVERLIAAARARQPGALPAPGALP